MNYGFTVIFLTGKKMPTSKIFLLSGPKLCTIEEGEGFVRKMNSPKVMSETGSFKVMQILLFKNLTLFLIVSAFFFRVAFAETFYQESYSTHLRWNLQLPKEQVLIKKENDKILIQTLNIELFNKLTDDMAKLKIEKSYFSNIKYNRDNYPQEPATIALTLKNSNVEMFNFYQMKEKKYVLDFWINDDVKFDAPSKNIVAKKLTPQKAKIKKAIKKSSPKVIKSLNEELKNNPKPLDSILVEKRPLDEKYRDFRYGASFIWDYDPLKPSLEKDINLQSKIPAAFYPIKDRDYEKDEKEAHMQLTINMFKKEKWGLLNKSISLYETKFGKDSNFEMNEFLKANSLLKKNIKDKNKGIASAAQNILNSLLETSQDYELRRAINRYLIQANLDRGDYIQGLALARKLFFDSKEQYDKEMTIYTSKVILHCLSSLKQNEKINEFLSDKYIKKILPNQIGHAYNSYALLIRGDDTDVIRLYEENKKGLVSPVHPSILFNTAEAYFRESNYKEAVEIYDEFLKHYSYLDKAPHSRLRIALCYEIQEKPLNKVMALYKNALDRSPNPQIRYEAKLRYLGVNLLRKKDLYAEDLEKEIFFEMSPDERKAMTKEMKKLLWLVRLRSYINRKMYKQALTYLTGIPMNALKPLRRKVFQADGAEIIYGLIGEAYNNENYSKAVKLWETFKESYDDRVSVNPHVNFLVASSYLKLGLPKSFDRVLSNFQGLESYATRVYPIWVERNKDIVVTNMLKEIIVLRHIEKEEWHIADKMLDALDAKDRTDINYAYYRGIVDYELKRYAQAANDFEYMLINQNERNRLGMNQLAFLIKRYVESLHKTSQTKRLIKTATALLRDLDKQEIKLDSLVSSKERLHYLLVENLYSLNDADYPKVEKYSSAFLKGYKDSQYKDRVKYLFGLAMIKNLKVEQGSEILNSMISDKDVPGYLKEMAKTELSAIKLGVKI